MGAIPQLLLWCLPESGLFFVGYILTQIPTNMILDKVRPSLFLPCVMCCWAVVSTCTGAVRSYGGLVALRFVLGKTILALQENRTQSLTCSRLRRSTFLSRRFVPTVVLVHEERVGSPNLHPIRRRSDGRSIRRSSRQRDHGWHARSSGVASVEVVSYTHRRS